MSWEQLQPLVDSRRRLPLGHRHQAGNTYSLGQHRPPLGFWVGAIAPSTASATIQTLPFISPPLSSDPPLQAKALPLTEGRTQRLPFHSPKTAPETVTAVPIARQSSTTGATATPHLIQRQPLWSKPPLGPRPALAWPGMSDATVAPDPTPPSDPVTLTGAQNVQRSPISADRASPDTSTFEPTTTEIQPSIAPPSNIAASPDTVAAVGLPGGVQRSLHAQPDDTFDQATVEIQESSANPITTSIQRSSEAIAHPTSLDRVMSDESTTEIQRSSDTTSDVTAIDQSNIEVQRSSDQIEELQRSPDTISDVSGSTSAIESAPIEPAPSVADIQQLSDPTSDLVAPEPLVVEAQQTSATGVDNRTAPSDPITPERSIPVVRRSPHPIADTDTVDSPIAEVQRSPNATSDPLDVIDASMVEVQRSPDATSDTVDVVDASIEVQRSPDATLDAVEADVVDTSVVEVVDVVDASMVEVQRSPDATSDTIDVVDTLMVEVQRSPDTISNTVDVVDASMVEVQRSPDTVVNPLDTVESPTVEVQRSPDTLPVNPLDVVAPTEPDTDLQRSPTPQPISPGTPETAPIAAHPPSLTLPSPLPQPSPMPSVESSTQATFPSGEIIQNKGEENLISLSSPLETSNLDQSGLLPEPSTFPEIQRSPIQQIPSSQPDPLPETPGFPEIQCSPIQQTPSSTTPLARQSLPSQQTNPSPPAAKPWEEQFALEPRPSKRATEPWEEQFALEPSGLTEGDRSTSEESNAGEIVYELISPIAQRKSAEPAVHELVSPIAESANSKAEDGSGVSDIQFEQLARLCYEGVRSHLNEVQDSHNGLHTTSPWSDIIFFPSVMTNVLPPAELFIHAIQIHDPDSLTRDPFIEDLMREAKILLREKLQIERERTFIYQTRSTP